MLFFWSRTIQLQEAAMKITKIEIVKNAKPISLPEPWRPAWNEPDIPNQNTLSFAFYRVHTDEGITGIGPCGLGPGSTDDSFLNDSFLIGYDPHYVQRFFDKQMRGYGTVVGAYQYAGIEIAMWDILGKAANKPVYKLLGAATDKVLAYGATSQLKSPEDSVRVAEEFQKVGIKAIKLRLHRPDPEDDLEVVRAVRAAVGPDMRILVDANQNHTSLNYSNWSRKTAAQAAKILDELDVWWLEEPLPRTDLEGLSHLCREVDMHIAGGEHLPDVYGFRDVLLAGAYDIVQPDVILGNIGIIGIRHVATIADAVGRQIAPHVCGGGNNGIYLAATLQAVATVRNCPIVEFTLDPPALTPDTSQLILKEPILIDEDGYLALPEKPGIGVEIDEDRIDEYL